MKIDFYEEFPGDENLEKLKLIKFEARLFVAAKSLAEFLDLEKLVKKINKRITCAYWPIVKGSYWVSPFSNNADLRKMFNELEKCDNHLLIDLELPLNKKLILRNIFHYFKNRRLIKRFLERNRGRITTAQFPSSMISLFMKILGLDYRIDVEKSFMWYSSMVPRFVNKNIRKNLLRLKNKRDCSVSLGTIAIGIFGNEPILPPAGLERDLEFVKSAGFSRVIVFRLGGLDEEYMKVVNKFR